MFIEKDQMVANEYIQKTREYLDYIEEHIENIRLAFQEVSKKCDGMAWVGDDYTWHTLRGEVCCHDISKFSKEEFTAYRNKFYPMKNEIIDRIGFDIAWENHKKENPHHWETIESGINGDTHRGLVENNIVHMIVDWTAMGYKFGDTAQEYYEANKDKIKIDEKYIPFMYEIFNRLADEKGI